MSKCLIIFVILIYINKITPSINDKFLDYDESTYFEFVPLDSIKKASNHSMTNNIQKLKSLNSTFKNEFEKKKQLDIATNLIDSINIDFASVHNFGKLLSADQLTKLNFKYSKDDLLTIKLEYLGVKYHANRRFNHYVITEKKKNIFNEINSKTIDELNNSKSFRYTNKSNDYDLKKYNKRRMFFETKNSYKLYKGIELNKNPLSYNQDRYQLILSSIYVQHRVNFGRKTIRLAFYKSLNDNLKDKLFDNSYEQNQIHNVWLTDDRLWSKNNLKPMERIHILDGWGLLWKSID